MNDLKSWFNGNIYNMQVFLTFRDCDMKKRVKLSSVLSFLADSAGNDYYEKGFSHEKLLEMRQVFLISKISLRIHTMPMTNDVLTVSTWENGSKGAVVNRNFEITLPDGKPCISATSTWLIVDPVSRKICRPSSFKGRIIEKSERVVDCYPCEKLSCHDTEFDFLGEHKVVFSNLDGNGHLYSANYGNIAVDFLPEKYQLLDICDFSIDYIKEARIEETIQIYGHEDDENCRYTIMGQCNGKDCFACRFYF